MVIRRAALVLALLVGVAIVPVAMLGTGRAHAATAVAVAADAFVSDAHPDTNYGAAAWVTADARPLRYGYFKFDVDVPAGQIVTGAVFRCWAGSDDAFGATIWPASSDWSEQGITWANAPLPDLAGASLGVTGPVLARSYVFADVTSSVVGTGTYTFVTTTQSPVGWSCASRENTEEHPAELLITTASAPTPTSTSSGPSTSSPSSSTSPAPTSSTTSPAPTDTGSAPPPTAEHKLLVIVLENHSEAEALAQMPHLATWATTYGQATSYYAVTHPSLPNYLAIWGGSTFGVTTDCSVGSSGCVPSAPSVWGQTLAVGETAKAYQESMSSNCQTAGSGEYAPRHGPWPYWLDTTERAGCDANDVASGTTTNGPLAGDIAKAALPVTGELTPNLCNDGHDCGLNTADGWLASWIPLLVSGPDYATGHLTILITFDEDDGTQGNRVPFVVIDPRLLAKTVTGRFDHYSLTRWLEDNAGVTELRNAGSAPDLRAAFGL